MNNSITTSDLARWLRPSSIELTADRLAELDSVVAELASSLNGRELDAVAAAYGRLSDGARVWAAGVLSEKAPTLDPQHATALVERVLAATVMSKLAASRSGMRCALAIGSAQFLGLIPLIEDLPARSTEVLASAGRSARQRAAIEAKAASSALGSLPEARQRNDETGEEIQLADVADDVGTHAQSLQSLVNVLDNALDVLARRQDSLDEEVEMLWWALRATDNQGTPFSDLEPAVRVVSAAGELADRTTALPGPPSAGFLLGRVLSDSADNETALADLAAAVLVHRQLCGSPHTLLPLLSAAAEQVRLCADKDDDTWQIVVERTLGIDLTVKTTLANGAQQVYRELLLERLLTADA